MFTKTAAAAVLLAAIPTAYATVGNATIQNQCSFPVYLWSVSDVAPANPTVIDAGALYSEPYYTNPNGGGISIKIGTANPAPLVTQFEYTLDTADNALWYDISNINGYPFEQWGFTLVPSDATCASVTCDPNVAKCTDVYNKSDDDKATHECAATAEMVMVLCSGGAAAASSIASSAIVAATSAAKKSTATSSSTTVVAPTTTSTKTSAAVSTSTTTSSKAVVVVSTSSTTPVAVPSTSSSSADVVLTTTFVTQIVTVSGSSSSSVIPTTTDAAKSTTTQVDVVFHGHTFHWPSFTGSPGSKVRRGHQHFHAHAQAVHHHV